MPPTPDGVEVELPMDVIGRQRVQPAVATSNHSPDGSRILLRASVSWRLVGSRNRVQARLGDSVPPLLARRVIEQVALVC
jgi:hypothetical protein